MSELVPQAVHDLLAFYTEHCPEVRFGDLDLRVLERTISSLDEAASRVIKAEEAVAEARQQFREVESGLLTKVNRTLSFLRIFVDEDEDQIAKLDAIASGLPATRRKARAATESGAEPRQRRPRKRKNADDAGADADSVDETAEAADIEAADVAPIASQINDVGDLGDDNAKEMEKELQEAPVAASSGKKSGK